MKDLNLLEISSFMPSSIRVFESYGLDYYRKGWRTLGQACDDCGLDVELISNLLSEMELSGLPQLYENYIELAPDEIISRIRYKFHAAEIIELPLLCGEFEKLVMNDPGNSVLVNLRDRMHMLAEDFLEHARHEEESLFPYIIRLADAEKYTDNQLLRTLFHNELSLFEHEHDDSTSRIEQIRKDLMHNRSELSDQVVVEDILGLLSRFIHDLHLHLHVENNILFPKSRLLESKLRNRLKQTG